MSGRGTKRSAAAAGMQATPTPATRISLSLPKAAKNGNTDDRPSKRIKTPMGAAAAAPQASSKVKEDMRTLINHLKKAADKTGRQFCDAFLSLPHPDDLPEYYEVVKLPIAFDTIEEKIEKDEYTSLDELDGDVKRMVLNAKRFNQTQSQIFEDAERIRKATYNWMHKNNPSYKISSHQAIPTPEPDEIDPSTIKAIRARVKLQQPAPSPLSQRESARSNLKAQTATATKAEEKQADDPTSFVGKSFQQAQEMIINDCMSYQDSESGLDIFIPFIDLPSRKELRDYYQIIQDPQCLRGVLRRVRGKRETGNTTDMRSWDAFEAELVKIAQNARTYNEDESDMYMLANEFEEYFRQRLAEAKRHVSEPTFKLNLGAKPAGLKIRLGAGSQKGSPAPVNNTKSASPAVNGVGTPTSVDQQALQRQKGDVQAALGASSANTPLPVPSSQPSGGGIKPEQSTPAGTPGAGTLQPNGVVSNGTAANMPPPHVRANSGPAPFAQSVPPAFVPQLPGGIDSKFRQDGKGAADALLQKLTVVTDPSLRIAKPLSISTQAHETLCHQSVTLNLPPSHRQLRLDPILHGTFFGSNARPWRMFVTANGSRLQPIPQTGPKTGRPAYTVSLSPGMNRKEIEVVAAKERSPDEMEHHTTRSKTSDLEIERCSVYAHLLKI